jgi:hypothetical protein
VDHFTCHPVYDQSNYKRRDKFNQTNTENTIMMNIKTDNVKTNYKAPEEVVIAGVIKAI